MATTTVPDHPALDGSGDHGTLLSGAPGAAPYVVTGLAAGIERRRRAPRYHGRRGW
jgi:hypothetical protein